MKLLSAPPNLAKLNIKCWNTSDEIRKWLPPEITLETLALKGLDKIWEQNLGK